MNTVCNNPTNAIKNKLCFVFGDISWSVWAVIFVSYSSSCLVYLSGITVLVHWYFNADTRPIHICYHQLVCVLVRHVLSPAALETLYTLPWSPTAIDVLEDVEPAPVGRLVPHAVDAPRLDRALDDERQQSSDHNEDLKHVCPDHRPQTALEHSAQLGRKEMFYLTTHSTHFIYGYMASHIWLRTILIVRKETRCCHIGYSYRLTARVLLYAPPHRQDNTYHGLCYTSRGTLAGTRNSSMGPPHEGSIRRPIVPWANALTTELHLAPHVITSVGNTV